MLEQFRFYFWHSLNDLRVNGQRTFFALLCIAAGVAAVVSLQTVAIMIGDTLTGNLQASNRGDIQAALDQEFGDSDNQALYEQGAADGILEPQPQSGLFDNGATQYRIGAGGLAKIQAWLDENFPGEVEMTYPYQVGDFASIFTGGVGTSVTTAAGDAASQVSPILIDPAVYPFYNQVVSLEGKSLPELLAAPNDIVIDENVAETLGAKAGDTLRVNGVDVDFTLRGVVPTQVEVSDPGAGLLTALFGFYYLNRDAIQYFPDLQPQTDKLYLKISDPVRVTEINTALIDAYPYLQTTTVETLRAANQNLADQINQMVTVVGLVSLLLGSIGIINTMQVIVRRRIVEVAVLKTIGLQAGQVTVLFLVEAFIMGIIGSIFGILLGWATTFAIKGVAENLVAQPLPFRIALAPVVNGLLVGTLVTTIFGFLPTLTAGQVRPGVVLRPNDTIIPRAGCLRTVFALIVIILALSVVAYTILGNFVTALVATVGAFMAAGLLVFLLWLLIWVIGRFLPSFGSVDLKISLRQMLAGRGRAAVTLLALVVGVFSLSLITLLADSINTTLASALGSGGGGSVIIVVSNRDSIPAVETAIASVDSVVNHQVVLTYSGQLVALEEADGTVLDAVQLEERIEATSTLKQTIESFGGDTSELDVGREELNELGSLTTHDLSQPLPNRIKEGRDFTAADAGNPVIIFTDYPAARDAGLTTGDKVTYAFGEGADAQQITFELIGVAHMPAVSNPTSGRGTFILPDALPETILPAAIQVAVDIPEASIPELRRAMSVVPGTFLLETAVLVKLITSLLATFTAFPTMVALLGLVVGGVVIANSVALTTMERRREIAVMKAVGLQRWRVLLMLLLENGILGLIGGMIGVGLGLLMLVVLLSATGSGLALPFGTALLLMLLCVLVSLVAAGTTAWSASGEKPLNVLRYE